MKGFIPSDNASRHVFPIRKFIENIEAVLADPDFKCCTNGNENGWKQLEYFTQPSHGWCKHDLPFNVVNQNTLDFWGFHLQVTRTQVTEYNNPDSDQVKTVTYDNDIKIYLKPREALDYAKAILAEMEEYRGRSLSEGVIIKKTQ